MKNTIRFLLVSNAVFFSAAYLVQRFEQSLENGTESSSNESAIRIEFSSFEQKLDHFDLEDDRKWNQRTWYSTDYFKDGGPAFLLINGEWEVDPQKRFVNASWVSYAKTFNAACFATEHRYFGKSWPKQYNRKYLNIAQALADIAYFIKTTSDDNSWLKNSKWIVFGCSYAGSLAAWVRMKYPHLVYSAVTSSASLLSKVVYQDYGQTVEKALESYDVRCVESIGRAIEEIIDLNNHTEKVNDIKEMFELRYHYKPEEMNYIAKMLLSELKNIFACAVLHNDTTDIDIPTVCDTMINQNGTKLEAFAELRRKNTESEKNSTGSSYSTRRSWKYQFCSETGGNAGFDDTRYLFDIDRLKPLEDQTKEDCESVFGPDFGIEEMDRRMQQTNFLYGGLNFNAANTLFIHGSADPWHTSAPYNTTEDSLYETILVNGTSHCADTNLFVVKKNPGLQKAYEEVVKILKKWLRK